MVRPSALAVLRLIHQLEFRGLLHWQVSVLGALQDFVDVDRCSAVHVKEVRTVRHQAAGLHEPLLLVRPRSRTTLVRNSAVERPAGRGEPGTKGRHHGPTQRRLTAAWEP
jgi:hypothetical protein